jgi:vacuolar-type H+-ATPase subunit I/STV1
MKSPHPYLVSSRSRCLSTITSSGILGIVLFAIGCSSLPDVSPFRAASAQLRSAVAESGAAVESELRLLPDGTASADDLRNKWNERNKAFTAIVSYSDSINSLVNAGNNGAKSAESVANSLKALGESAGIAIPASDEAANVAIDIAKLIYQQIAKVRAAKNLENAMSAAQPAIDRIAEKINEDLKDLEEIYIAANRLDDNRVRTEHNQFTSYRNAVLQRIGAESPANTNSTSIAAQAQLIQMLRDMEGTYNDYTAQRKEVSERLRAGQAVIIAASQASSNWAAAHVSVTAALKQRRPVDISSLQEAALQINNLIKRMRDI